MIAAKLKEFFASKTILFIGFSFEDINIDSLYEKILSLYKDTSKKHYFVSPYEKEHKINKLNSRGIVYVQSDAKQLVSSLDKRTKRSLLLM